MSERLHRAQLLLEPNQYEKLTELAKDQGKSISAMTREILTLGLKLFRSEKDRRLEALEKLQAIRKGFAQKHGVYLNDIVAEVREEREKQITEEV